MTRHDPDLHFVHGVLEDDAAWLARHAADIHELAYGTPGGSPDPHPALCWKCPPDMQDYVDRYDMLGRPWCHSCWALHLLAENNITHDTPTKEVLADAT